MAKKGAALLVRCTAEEAEVIRAAAKKEHPDLARTSCIRYWAGSHTKRNLKRSGVSAAMEARFYTGGQVDNECAW